MATAWITTFDGDTITVIEVNENTSNVGEVVTGTNGGTFTINGDGSYTFDVGTAFDSLAVGETATTSVDYTISDGNGGTDTATVIVTVNGANDAPTAEGTIPPQQGVDATVQAPLDISDFFGDLDTSDTLAFSDGGTLPPGLTIDPGTGIISGVYTPDASQGGPYNVVITADDGNGGSVTQTFTWSVTNPAPIATNDDFVTDEDTAISGNIVTVDNTSGVDSDPDGDLLTLTEVNGLPTNVGSPVTGSNGGVFTVNPDGSFVFDPQADFGDLGVGETAITQVTYTIEDGNGGSDSATITVTVNGMNDAPTADGTIPAQVNLDGDAIAVVDVSPFFADIDSPTLTFSDGGTLPPGLTIDPASGQITGTIDNSASTMGPFAVVITADDGDGGTITQTFTWSVTNPAPDANDNTNSVLADGPNSASGNVILDVEAGLLDTDPDGDTLAVTNIAGTPVTQPTDVQGSFGLLTVAPDGSYEYELDATNPIVIALAPGDVVNETFAYTIDDGEGGTDTANLVITINGANDAPIAISMIPDQTGIDADTTPNVPLAGFFGDPDTGETLTFSGNGTLPPGLVIDAVTGVVSGTFDNDASVGGPYEVEITATDSSGATVTQTFTWAVGNPPPTAINDIANTDQDTSITFNVITPNDTDPDGDTLTVSAVNDNQVTVGQVTTGTNGGQFIVQADGTVTFDPAGDFDDLGVGETAATEITYTITDSQGGTSEATITVTIDGLNEAPEALGLPDQFNAEGEPIDPVDVSNGFEDSDPGDTLTFADNGTLPPGLVLDLVTGIVTGTPAEDTAQTGRFPVTITATDSQGATTSQTFVWNISGTFAFDSFNDFSDEEKSGQSFDIVGNRIFHREVLLSEQVERLAPEPILAGYARPGSVLIGRIYDASGSIVGETNLTVGPSGNWTMHFFGTQQSNHTRVVIEHIGTENVALGTTALKLTDETYRAMQLDATAKPSTTAGSILDATASETQKRQDGENLNPLGLL